MVAGLGVPIFRVIMVIFHFHVTKAHLIFAFRVLQKILHIVHPAKL